MGMLEKMLEKKNQQVRRPYGYETPQCVKEFHENIDAIIEEWKNYVASSSSNGTPIDELSSAQGYLNEDKKWKAFFVHIYGETPVKATKYFPVTARLADKWKDEVKLVFFSNLEPGKHIQPHKGNNHGVIRSQIGIDIGQPETTGVRVEDKTFHIKNKEYFTFDDTFEHEAWNRGSGDRTVLIIDSCKNFSYFYSIINKYLLSKMKDTEYVQSTLEKLKKTN